MSMSLLLNKGKPIGETQPPKSHQLLRLERTDGLFAFQVIIDAGWESERRWCCKSWTPPKIHAEYQRRIETSIGYRVIVDDETVGVFLLDEDGFGIPFREEQFGEAHHCVLCIISRAVSPKWLGLGLGQWCLERIEALAVAIGRFDVLCSDAADGHQSLHLFCKRRGFKDRGKFQLEHSPTTAGSVAQRQTFYVRLFEKVLLRSLPNHETQFAGLQFLRATEPESAGNSAVNDHFTIMLARKISMRSKSCFLANKKIGILLYCHE